MPPFVSGLLDRVAARQEFVLVGLLVLTTAMMILPMPTALADVLIATNIGLAVLLMMVAIYITAPVEFSTLPSVILITTAFRLSLSITTSRMVLVQGDAGSIIRTFGEFVIAGNVVVGLVVYLIITIVQFVVITKGSERVAEVAARFTLDALPGKQISIDTDLRNGDIDAKEARRRRRNLEKESQLYGAMDGAMKFVKGDAIASLVIIIVNLIGGITIGCLQRGLPFSGAAQTYSLLAVGDGLIAQIPALLISLTAGVIVTRATSETGGNLGRDIMMQMTGQPRTLQIAAVVLTGLGFVPGFPTAVFLTMAVLLGGTGWALAERAKEDERRAAAERAAAPARAEAAALRMLLGASFRAEAETLDADLDAMRQEVGTHLGIAVPRPRVVPDAVPEANGWQLQVNGVPAAQGVADTAADVVLRARPALCRVASQFVGIQETQALLKTMEPAFSDLVREATKSAPLPRIAEVLRRLLDEGIPVSNLRTILEVAAEWGEREQNTAILTEHARVGLRRQICYEFAKADKVLPVVLIEASLDEAMRALINATPKGTELELRSSAVERIASALRRMKEQRTHAVVLASSELRRHLRKRLDREGVDAPVLTYAELPHDFRLDVLGTLQKEEILPASERGLRDFPRLVAVPSATTSPL
jgi:type III secretion protein V